MTITEEQEFIMIGCLKCDPDSGEVLGVVLPHDDFVINTVDRARWALRKYGEHESEIAAIDSDADVLLATAILENARKLKKKAEDRLAYLHHRFDEELGRFARTQLDSKGKTWCTPVGSVSFRTVKGGLRVVDKDKALVWAKQNTPDAIKTSEEFQISKLTGIGRALAEADAASASSAFEIKPDAEVVKATGGAL